ncbi:hypothetical protein [Paracoccus sp. KR1-242]|uniref:hypothetical protein n=1 Tax=Paracoccus sp. KR1-242 TaxID=3410028 RepID=UPI003BFB0101
MRVFSLGSLDTWNQIACGQLMEFATPSIGYRKVEFDLMAEERVTVYAVSGDDTWLIGCGDGEITCKFATDRTVGVVVMCADPEQPPDVFMRTFIEAPVVPQSLDPSFTSIEPRPSGPSAEFQQMMHLMRLNSDYREQQLREELERMRAEQGQVIEPPVTAPEAAPAGDEGGAA